jgi:hypothetical protein
VQVSCDGTCRTFSFREAERLAFAFAGPEGARLLKGRHKAAPLREPRVEASAPRRPAGLSRATKQL